MAEVSAAAARFQLLWGREEDLTLGPYHSITQCKLRSRLGAAGKMQALHMRVSGQSILAGIVLQRIRDGRDAAVVKCLNNGGGDARRLGQNRSGRERPEGLSRAVADPWLWRLCRGLR